jgi:hypothetical protein
MRKVMSFATALILLALLVTAAPAAAAAPTIDAGQEKGLSAWADSYVCDDDGVCEFTFVSAFSGRSHYNGERFRGDNLCVTQGTEEFDPGTDTYTVRSESGCSPDAVVSFGAGLGSASAEGTITTESSTCVYGPEGEDCTPGPAGELDAAVEWTAISGLSKGSFKDRSQESECTWTYSSKGTRREAAAQGAFDGADVSFDFGSIEDGQVRFRSRCH